MKVKTSELIGAALDWAVAKCEGMDNLRKTPHRFDLRLIMDDPEGDGVFLDSLNYSTCWSKGGPIIERENLCVGRKHQADTNYCEVNDPAVDWWARTTAGGYLSYGPTPLIAAMRALVKSKLGDEVDVPEELK